MSKAKLYSRDEWDESSSMFVSIPATNAEIKAAHPKCVTCEYCSSPNATDGAVCSHPENVAYSDYTGDQHPRWINHPFLDYCRHHTPKEH